ncbi:YncE family protein [Streptomyces sp. NRRL S-1824]|uniref:YncE family protein n=1 Tax=Streptomyces sp. NRRL S-1824 TaxID=1463889 RepID=UPI0004CA132D|nr:YncE family protein [Streptomyces sp. NRRL S-1824]
MAGLVILAGLALPAIAPFTATVNVGTNPVGVAITPDGLRAYVVNGGSGNVSVIDTASNMVTATVGTNPRGVAITPDGLHAYVTNIGSGNVSVIATASNMVTATATATVTLGTQPNGVAISPISPAEAAATAMAELARALQPVAQQTATACRDRPAWAPPTGPVVNPNTNTVRPGGRDVLHSARSGCCGVEVGVGCQCA